MPAKADKSFFNRIEYVKNTMEIEGYKICKRDLDFFKEIEDNKYSKKQIIQKVLKTHKIQMKDYDLKDNHYCYKGSFVLKNKFDIKDKKTLDSVEKDITGSFLLLLQSRNFHNKELNYEFFMWLHKYIFGDIYNWAGNLRVVDLTKGEFKFAHYPYLNDLLCDYFLKLKKDNYMIDYEYDEILEKLTYFITELNIIHPFREGNGRVIREYFRILLERKNLFIDYSDKGKYLEAMIESPYSMDKLKQFLSNNLRSIENQNYKF